MIINIIYIMVILIFLFLVYIIIKSFMRGLDGKKKTKKTAIEITVIKQY